LARANQHAPGARVAKEKGEQRMKHPRRHVGPRLAAALATVATLVLVGCTTSTTQTPTVVSSVNTARHAYEIARSALSTIAPDGRMLIAETVWPVSATSTPIWQFLIGSPKTGTTYAAVVNQGQGFYQKYSEKALPANEWAAVPLDSAWKVDSDAALTAALGAFPAGKGAPYTERLVTYVPKSAKAPAKPMTWAVAFQPQEGATTTVEVDVSTGAATLSK
jgi:hypothetical protein